MEDNPILKKQLSIEYAGNIDNYESFKRTVGASPLLYKHDLHFYNDDITSRHKRNIQELKYLKELLKSGKIEHKMVKHNVINTFYPSFVLQHHY
jgi:beta-galactosidase GanA